MSSSAVRAGRAFIEIFLKDHVTAAMTAMANNLSSIGATINQIGGTLLAAGGGAVTSFAAAPKVFAAQGDELDAMSQRTGIAVERLSQLGFAAGQSSTSLAEVANGVRAMQGNLADLAGGADSAEAKFAGLKLTWKDMQGLTPDRQLLLIADRLKAIQDPARRTSIAMDIFGKSGANLIPFLAQGSAGIEALMQRADALGLTMSSSAAAAASKLNNALGVLTSTINGVVLAIGETLAPVFQAMTERAIDVAAKVNHFVREHPELIRLAFVASAAVAGLGGALLSLGLSLNTAAIALKGFAVAATFASTAVRTLSNVTKVAAVMQASFGLIAAGVSLLFSPLGAVVALVAAAGIAWFLFGDQIKAALAGIGPALSQLLANAQRIGGELGRHLMAGFQIAVEFARGVPARVAATFSQLPSRIGAAFKGLATMAQNALSGMFSTFDSTGAKLAGPFAGVAGAIQDGLGRGQEAVSHFASQLPAPLGAAVNALQAIGSRIYGTIAMGGGILANAVSQVPGLILQTLSSIPQLIGSLMSAAAARWARIAELLPAPLGKVVSAAAGVVNEVGKLFTSAGQLLRAAFTPAIEGLKYVVSAGATLATQMISRISAIAQPIARGVNIVLGAMIKQTLSLASNILKALSAAARPVTAFAGTVVSAATSTFARVVRFGASIASAFAGPFSGLVGSIGELFGSVAELVGSTVSSMLNVGVQTGASILEFLSAPLEHVQSAWQSITGTLGSVWSTISSGASTAFSAIGSFASNAGSHLQRIFSASVEGIGTVFSGLWSLLQSGWTGMLEFGATAIGGLTSAWSSFGSGVSQWFGMVVGEARTAWDGISAAIAVGDLQSAWTIAWNTMKLVYFQTVGPIRVAWLEFTTGLSSMFDGAVTAIRQTWNTLSNYIAQAMFTVLGSIKSQLDQIAEFDPTGMVTKLSEALDIDTEGINRTLEEDRTRFNEGLEAERQARDEARGAELSKLLAELQKQQAAAKEEIQKARQQALDKVKEKQQANANTPQQPGGGFDLQSRLDQLTNNQPKMEGTFSAAAAAMMAATGGGQGTAVERTAKNTDELKKSAAENAKYAAISARNAEIMSTYAP